MIAGAILLFRINGTRNIDIIRESRDLQEMNEKGRRENNIEMEPDENNFYGKQRIIYPEPGSTVYNINICSGK